MIWCWSDEIVLKLVIENADEDVNMNDSVYPGVFTSKAMGTIQSTAE